MWGSGLQGFVDRHVETIAKNEIYSIRSLHAFEAIVDSAKSNNDVVEMIKAAVQRDKNFGEKLRVLFIECIYAVRTITNMPVDLRPMPPRRRDAVTATQVEYNGKPKLFLLRKERGNT